MQFHLNNMANHGDVHVCIFALKKYGIHRILAQPIMPNFAQEYQVVRIISYT